MGAGKKKTTPEEALDALRDAQLDDLVGELDALSPAEADARLDALGGDAAGTRRRAAGQMAEIDARDKRMGAWETDARAKRDAAHAALADARARRPKLSRAEMLARVAALRSDARWSQPVATFFRKRKSEEMTDAELEAALDELEALRALDGEKGGGEDGGEGDA